MKKNPQIPNRLAVDPAALGAVAAGDEPTLVAPGPDPLDAQSNVLKTRHDTVKNTISNVR